MLNISKAVNLILDEQGWIQAEGLKSLLNDRAIEIRQLIKDNRGAIVEYLKLWNEAYTLADFVDGSRAAPYEDRASKLPELNGLVEKMRTIENRFNAVLTSSPVKEIPGLPDDLIQAPAVWTIGNSKDQGDHRDTCPACGQCTWWRKNEPGAKWICGRCHPPAPGLHVLFKH